MRDFSYDRLNRCCRRCKMLMDENAFKLHQVNECNRVKMNSTETFVEMLKKEKV